MLKLFCRPKVCGHRGLFEGEVRQVRREGLRPGGGKVQREVQTWRDWQSGGTSRQQKVNCNYEKILNLKINKYLIRWIFRSLVYIQPSPDYCSVDPQVRNEIQFDGTKYFWLKIKFSTQALVCRMCLWPITASENFKIWWIGKATFQKTTIRLHR